jgi:hypothetical protein
MKWTLLFLKSLLVIVVMTGDIIFAAQGAENVLIVQAMESCD